jgi:hypothetical protein
MICEELALCWVLREAHRFAVGLEEARVMLLVPESPALLRDRPLYGICGNSRCAAGFAEKTHRFEAGRNSHYVAGLGRIRCC